MKMPHAERVRVALEVPALAMRRRTRHTRVEENSRCLVPGGVVNISTACAV